MAQTKSGATRRRSPTTKGTTRRTASTRGKRGAADESSARAIWKGVIASGSLTLPVKLYSAVQDQSIHFRLLDAKTRQPVKQHMVDAESGDIVESAQVRKALQVSKRKMVVLDEGDIEQAEPKDGREIEVSRFLTPEKITHQWFERPYWLGPDGDAKTYFALVEALRDQNKEGFARWVMRKKEYAGVLRVSGDYLMLITLRHAEEVVSAARLKGPAGREPTKREIEMARTLVESMEGEWDMTEFKDSYRERVLELVKAKAAGKVLKFPRAKAAATADTSLEAVLRRSIEAGGHPSGRKSA